MKKTAGILSLILGVTLLSSCTINKPVEKMRYITVEGSGYVMAVPDTAEVEFTVTTTGWSAKQISTDNDTISQKFITAVVAVGVNENDISKSEVTVSNPGSSYEARRTIKVVSRNVSLVPAIVDCKTPLIKLKSVEYLLNDCSSEVRRARTAAVSNAQDSAGLLAGATGSKLGNVSAIENEKITKTSLSNGKIKIQSDLTLTYELN